MTGKLLSSTANFFKRNGYQVEYAVSFEGISGLPQYFDLLVKNEKGSHPVSVKDWRRTVGVNMVIKADMAAKDTRLGRPIVVAKKFSEHAKAYSHRNKVTLLTEREVNPRQYYPSMPVTKGGRVSRHRRSTGRPDSSL